VKRFIGTLIASMCVFTDRTVSRMKAGTTRLAARFATPIVFGLAALSHHGCPNNAATLKVCSSRTMMLVLLLSVKRVQFASNSDGSSKAPPRTALS